MIITNCISKIIVKIACWFLPNIKGITIYPFIFIYPSTFRINQTLVNHERKHLEQYKRYWIVGFLPLYIYYHIKYGYVKNPLEVEARLKSI